MRKLLNQMERDKVAKVTFEENRSYVVATSRRSMFKRITVRCQSLVNFVYTFPGRTLGPLLGFSGAADFRQRPAIQMAEEGRGGRGKSSDYGREAQALEDSLYPSGNGQMTVRERSIQYGRRANEWNCQRF